jgi:hypothetical protein
MSKSAALLLVLVLAASCLIAVKPAFSKQKILRVKHTYDLLLNFNYLLGERRHKGSERRNE